MLRKLERRQQALLRLIKQIQEDNGATLRPLTEENNSDPDLRKCVSNYRSCNGATAGGVVKKKKNAFCNRQLDTLTAEEWMGNLPF